MRKKWSKEEKLFLIENKDKLSVSEITNKLERPISSVRTFYRNFDKYKSDFERIKIGDKFNNWIIICDPYQRFNGKQNSTYVKVQCCCEKQTVTEQELCVVERGYSKSCGCSKSIMNKNKSADKFYKWKGYEEISGTYFNSLRNSAISRNIELNITIEDIWRVYLKQDKKCTLTGLPIEFSKRQTLKMKSKGTASVDRIDSNKPYMVDNIQIVHKVANKMKLDFDQSKFIKYCSLVATFNKNNIHDLEDNSINEDIKRNCNWIGCGLISGSYWCDIRHGANRRKIDLNLSISDAWEIFQKQKGYCAFTGLPLIFVKNFKKDSKKQTASLDRIDNNVEYNKENVQWVHKDINKIRQKMTIDEFKYWCQLIYIKHRL